MGTGRVDPQCPEARLHPGTRAPHSLGKGPRAQSGALGLTGVGDFPQKDDALGVFENYGNQEGPVKMHNSHKCGPGRKFHPRGSSSFRALLIHVQHSAVDHLWGQQSITDGRPGGQEVRSFLSPSKGPHPPSAAGLSLRLSTCPTLFFPTNLLAGSHRRDPRLWKAVKGCKSWARCQRSIEKGLPDMNPLCLSPETVLSPKYSLVQGDGLDRGIFLAGNCPQYLHVKVADVEHCFLLLSCPS